MVSSSDPDNLSRAETTLNELMTLLEARSDVVGKPFTGERGLALIRSNSTTCIRPEESGDAAVSLDEARYPEETKRSGRRFA